MEGDLSIANTLQQSNLHRPNWNDWEFEKNVYICNMIVFINPKIPKRYAKWVILVIILVLALTYAMDYVL